MVYGGRFGGLPTYEPQMPPALKGAFQSMQIKRSALARINGYANQVGLVFGRQVELYGFLLAQMTPQGLEAVVSDAWLARGQIATMGSVALDENAVLQAGREISQQDMRVVGWWHSHGSMKPFFSGTDIDNNYVVLSQISPFTERQLPSTITMPVTVNYAQNGHQPPLPYVSIEGVEPSLAANLKGQKATLHMPLKVSFSYNLVVNAANDEPATTLSVEDFSPALGVPVKKTYLIPLEIIDDEKQVDLAVLANDLEERVTVNRWWLTSILHYGPEIPWTEKGVTTSKRIRRRGKNDATE